MGVIFGNDTVTVFNRYFDIITEEEMWFPTLLKGVNLVSTKGANISKSGLNDADTARLFIDVDSVENKTYHTPKLWNQLTVEDKANAFTFQTDTDFFVKGDLTDVEPFENNFFEWVLNHYDYVFKVSTVDEYSDVLPHLEIGGK